MFEVVLDFWLQVEYSGVSHRVSVWMKLSATWPGLRKGRPFMNYDIFNFQSCISEVPKVFIDTVSSGRLLQLPTSRHSPSQDGPTSVATLNTHHRVQIGYMMLTWYIESVCVGGPEKAASHSFCNQFEISLQTSNLYWLRLNVVTQSRGYVFGHHVREERWHSLQESA